MIRLLRRNTEFWNHERSLTALLVYLSLSLFLSLPLAGHRWLEFFARDLLFIMIALSGIFAVTTRTHRQVAFIMLAAVAVMLRIVTFASENQWVSAASDLTNIIFFILLTRMVLTHIFKDGPVNYYRIEGSIVVFILAGMIWGYLYHLLEKVSPDSFRMTDATAGYDQFIYFSFVTMTTLGTGDILPVHPLAKSLTIFQGMFGLLYPVVMIARLVALEIEHKRARS